MPWVFERARCLSGAFEAELRECLQLELGLDSLSLEQVATVHRLMERKAGRVALIVGLAGFGKSVCNQVLKVLRGYLEPEVGMSRNRHRIRICVYQPQPPASAASATSRQ